MEHRVVCSGRLGHLFALRLAIGWASAGCSCTCASPTAQAQERERHQRAVEASFDVKLAFAGDYPSLAIRRAITYSKAACSWTCCAESSGSQRSGPASADSLANEQVKALTAETPARCRGGDRAGSVGALRSLGVTTDGRRLPATGVGGESSPRSRSRSRQLGVTVLRRGGER